jgi:hypothetical protein
MMDWAGLNAHHDVKRDRTFQVTVRPHEGGEKRTVAVKLTAIHLGDIARSGPFWPQVRAAAANKAQALPLGGFQWWGDPIEEIAA